MMVKITQSWPTVVMVDPAPLSPETFRSRFRDAVKGVTKYGLRQDLMSGWMFDYSVVEEKGGYLLVGPKELVRYRKEERPEQVGQIVSGVAEAASEVFEGPDVEIVRAIATLMAAGFLGSCKVSGVTEEFIYSCFPEGYEGGVQDNGDGTLTIF